MCLFRSRRLPRPEVSIRKIHPLAVVGSVVGRPQSYPVVARFLATVWTHFFYPQYRLRWFAKDRRIYSVNAGIDAEIPFRPEYYPKYLSFVSLWLKTLGFVRKTGGDLLMPKLLDFVSDMDRLYREAGAISRA